ncbi:MAG: hypothetical protein KA419_20065 [Acidobacteria bacterium]|nr:hypothetical protein [Acidobacteriota bacterium]
MFHFRPTFFRRVLYRLRFPFHLVRRPGVVARLLGPFLRHPGTARGNARLRKTAVTTAPFPGACFGVPGPDALLARIDRSVSDWQAGRRASKPELLWMQAYCQKPAACACGTASTRAGVQRRFNTACVIAPAGGGPVCGGAIPCRVGVVRRTLAGTWENLVVRQVVMTDELLMSSLWAECLDRQARAGEPTPFVMEICPFAVWIADQALFRLRTPLGVAFFLDAACSCTTYAQYLRADAGRKDLPGATPLDPGADRAVEDFANRVVALAGQRLAPPPAGSIP